MKEVTETFRRLRESIGDRYTIERELGRGGMATVYLARDTKHDREVAVKVLLPELSASIGAERFEREIKLAAKLQHPHILALYDSGVADGLLYYVMPFVKGESLRDKLDREGMLPVEDAIRLTLEICGALQHAHDQGIVHRDIKPENILLAHDHALVADFGIARAASEAGQQKLTQTGMAVGTPVYMAPEQSTGDVVGPTADIYSLGCMLYEMLAGEPPFTGPNSMAIMAKHLMEQVPSVRVVRSAVPDEVEQAIFFALAKTPVDRPKSAQAFAEVLGTPMGATATMRVMRGSQMMRGSMAMRRTPSGEMLGFVEPVPLWKRPATLITAAALVVAGVASTWALSRDRGPQSADPTARRIAVLFFDDLSRDSTLGPVAAGMSEGMIRTLSRISAISVVSRSGAESVRGMADRDSIVARLNVGYLVQGDLEPVGDRVRVNYRLYHRTGTRVGGKSITVARDSVLLLQDSLAVLAANDIRQQLGPEIRLAEQQAATRSNDAWLAVQEGAQLHRRADASLASGDRPAAEVLFLQADSAFARAEAFDAKWPEPIVRRAALAYRRSRLVGTDPARIRPWVELGIGHADRALALAPDDPDALEVRGTLRFWGVLQTLPAPDQRRGWLMSAQEDLERSTTVNANQAGAWATLAAAYYQIPDKGLSDVMIAAQNALRADEFQANVVLVRARLANAAYDLGQFDQADRFCSDLEARHPGNVRSIRCRLYLQSIPNLPSYDIARAWRLVDSLVAASPADSTRARLVGNTWVAATIARASVRTPSLADSARAVARRSIGDAVVDQTRELALFGAVVSTILGDRADALRKLREYIAVDPTGRAGALRSDPGWWFRELANTPEWTRLVGQGP